MRSGKPLFQIIILITCTIFLYGSGTKAHSLLDFRLPENESMDPDRLQRNIPDRYAGSSGEDRDRFDADTSTRDRQDTHSLSVVLDAQSTTGPRPPADIDPGVLVVNPEASQILDVPAYLWKNGCGPTAAGMVLGYWDMNGYGELVSGSAVTQTVAVDDMISSSGNYADYCLPIDTPPTLLDDLSELPIGDEHPDDSIADFMKTSQSFHWNYYGWSWFSHMDDALFGYVQHAAPNYWVTTQNVTFGNFSWNAYKAEIDAGRPVVFLVDTNEDGSTDHFVPGIGYSEDGTNMYACRNTWDAGIHWYPYAEIANGQPWGIYGGTLFQIQEETPVITDTVVINELNPDWDEVEFYNYGAQVVDMTAWQIIDRLGDIVYIFPSFMLQPDSYVVVHEYGDPVDNSLTDLYTGDNINWVNIEGSASLIHSTGIGVDFVRWGTSTNLPPVGTSWSGTNPDGPPYGLNLGRDEASTDADDGSDWCPQSSSLGLQNVGCGLCYTPEIPSLSTPTNGATSKTLMPTFQWWDTNASNEYQIQIDEDPAFTSPIDATTTWTDYTPSSPLPTGTHYWRVRGRYTYGGCDVSGLWSDTWHVIVDSKLSGDILLVDDDNSSNDFTAVFTETLDALGKTYTVWDTLGGDTEPVIGALDFFETVIWFTGASEYLTGPELEAETALATWLEGGKCLLITSQDYIYSRGWTTFMSTYLGLGSINQDQGTAVITGTGTIFNGLGPYVLSYPFFDYSDRLSPDGTAGVAFSGTPGDVGIYKDNGVYQTSFLGFPFEAIPEASDRQDVMAAYLNWCRSSRLVYLPLVTK